MATATASSSSTAAAGVRELVPLTEHVCLPGEPALMLQPNAVVTIGGGLRLLAQPRPSSAAEEAQPVTEVLMAEYCATLSRTTHHVHAHVPRYTVSSPASRRYIAHRGDPVIAVIARKVSQHYYYCYIGSTATAYLDAVAFDGATKISKPRLAEGDLVYAYVKMQAAATYVDSTAPAPGGAGEVELACTAAEVGLVPKDWTSGEAVFGPLIGGRLLTTPLAYVRRLLEPCDDAATGGASRKRPRASAEGEEREMPASYLLHLLGTRVPFEVAVGLNGLVWVRGLTSEADAAAAARRTVAVSACIAEAQYDLTKAEMEARVESYFPS